MRPKIENLDTLPFPDKSCIDYQEVMHKERHNYLSAHGWNRFIFSRGCAFDCSYCSNNALSQVIAQGRHYYRFLSVKRAIAEIERDARQYNFKGIKFDDDIICLNKAWFYEFFTLYRERFSYPFICNLRPGTADEGVVRHLKECGAQIVAIGIEQGNEEFRRSVLNRKVTDEQIIELFALCRRHKLPYTPLIMVGFPHETRELFLDTVVLCRRVRAWGKAIIFQPYLGTELGRICEENGWLPPSGAFREREEAVISYPGFRKEEIQLCSDASVLLTALRFLPLHTPLPLLATLFRLLRWLKRRLDSLLR